MRQEEVIVQGLLTSFTTFGQASPYNVPFVFLHGWASSKEVWGNVIQSMPTNGFVYYTLDLPGFGKTELPKTVWTVADYTNFIAEFQQKLKIRQAIVVGHSFGGRVGIVLAATRPTLVTKLILVDSAGVYSSPRFKKMLALIAKLVRPFFRLRWTQPLRRKIYHAFGAQDYLATPKLNRTFVKVIGEDLTKYLDKINQPTLLIWGKDDLVTPISFAQHFLAKLPQAKLEVIDKAGHYSFLDQPEAFVSIIKSWL